METRDKILEVLTTISAGVRYSTSDWGRILGDDKREIRRILGDLETEGTIEIIRDEGRPDKPLYRLKEE